MLLAINGPCSPPAIKHSATLKPGAHLRQESRSITLRIPTIATQQLCMSRYYGRQKPRVIPRTHLSLPSHILSIEANAGGNAQARVRVYTVCVWQQPLHTHVYMLV